MHTRRLVKSGASSYTVSLPKEWLERNKLKRGNMVYIKEKSPGELSISPESVEEPLKAREITINVDDKELGTIEREITSAYVNNYNTIRITGSTLIDKTKDIRRILHNFTALEITEQRAERIVAKDLLNLKEVSIETSIRRMDMIIRSMMQDIGSIRNKSILENIQFRDFDVNKLYFLLFRLIKGALNDPVLAGHFDIDSEKALSVWYLAVNLENIADCCKSICLNLTRVGEEYDLAEFEELYKKVMGYYFDVMKAYYKKDKKLADNVALNRNGVIDRCVLLSEKNKGFEMLNLWGSLKEIENLICNIGRIVIDG
ncbi:phosphate uptake regulator PhoU [Candidatus Woesearchaeota archaeon]|nr:phosphate uptake regulator PhoU [Candidatus Woesearchaeota archaeon]